MLTIIMALAKVNGKYLFGDTSGKLPWGRIKEDMDFFKEFTSRGSSQKFICSQSTFNTLPRSVVRRLKPSIVEEIFDRDYNEAQEIVVLGGRKLIDSALPFADHVVISEIGGIETLSNSFIYLRDSTVEKLSNVEKETTCWYFHTPAFDPSKPHLKQAYCLTRDRYKTSK